MFLTAYFNDLNRQKSLSILIECMSKYIRRHTQMKHKIYYIYVQISIFVSGKYDGAHDINDNLKE